MNSTTNNDALEVEVELDVDEMMCALPSVRGEAHPTAPGPAAAVTATHVTPAATTTKALTATGSSAPLPTLPPVFAYIVGRVAEAPTRLIIAETFHRLLKVLDTLNIIEGTLARQRVLMLGGLFGEVGAQLSSLLAFVTEAVAAEDDIDEEARRAFDCMRFVVSHEMSKVFRQEFPGLTDDGRSPRTRAELTRAWGLLHNCLQQTAISLSQTFDRSVTGEQLFDDYKSKVENSFTLHRELKTLLQKVIMAERSNGILLKHSLVRHLEHFREDTMHFLMYKDWGEFSRYVDEVKRAFEEMEEFEPMLHEFAQYLSTLLHHVGMREVLNNKRARDTASGAAPAAG